MTTYSYETFPGQTIVRTVCDGSGYTFGELLVALEANGDGVVVADDSRCNGRILAIEGRPCRTLLAGKRLAFDRDGRPVVVSVPE